MENKIIRNKKNTKKNLKKLLKSENTFSSSAVSEILESCNSSKAVGNDTLTEFNITLNPMLNRGMKDFIENFDFNVLETEEEESSNLEDEEKSLPNDQQSVNLFQFEDEDKTTLRFSNPSSFLSYLKAFSDRSDPETQARIRACISDTAKKFPNSKLFKTRDMREICSKSLKSKRPPKERLKTEITESKSTKSSLKELPMDEKTQRIIYQQLKQVQDNLEKNQSVSSSTSSSSSSSSSSLSSSSVMNGRGKQEGESVLLMGAAQGFYELCQMVLSEDPSCVNDRDKDHTTALMEAADRGHHDVMRLLIHHHADVNARSKAGHTALHYAVSRGRLEAIEVLLNNGADLSVMDNSGHTPLMDAASQGNVPVAKLLVQYGANVNECSMDFKESTLTIAAYKGNKEMVEFLLDQGAEIEHKTDEMHTALLEACIENYTEVVKVLLEKGACVNTISDSCETPLGLAVTSNNDELARLLLEKGANVNERNEEDYTALMEAVQEGNMEMAALLLAYNADIDAMTEGKETALSLACRQRMVAMAGMLALNGANLELGGVTPLMGACKEGCVTLVNFLLKRGADVNTVGTNGDSALTCASEGGHKQVVLMLLQAGAIVDHESDDGSTPLMKAASCGHFEVVHQLHLHGANVNKSTNDNDMTVLSAACNAGHKDIVMYLISHGADTNYKLKDNSTMLMEACKSNHVHVALLLLNCFEESEKIALDASSTEHEEIEKVDGENKEVRQQQLFKQLQNVQQKQIPQQRKHFKPHHTENKAFCCNKQQLIKRCQQLNEEKLQLQQKQQQQQQPAFSDYLHGMSGISKSPPKCVARQGVLCAEEIEKQRLKQNEKVKGGEAKVCACVHDDDDEDDEEDDDDDLTYDLDYLIGMVGNEAWMDKNDEDEEEEDDDDYYEEYPESEHSIMTLKHKNARNEITISSDATSHNNLDFSTAAIIPNVLNASTPAAIAVDHELPDVVSTSNGRDVVDSSDAICGVKVDDVNGGSLVKSKGNENGDVKMNGGDLVERGVDSDISKSFAKNVKNKINNKVNHKHNNEKVNNDSKINKKNEKMLREDGDGCAASRSSSLPQHSPSSSSSASQSSCNSDKFEDARVCFFNNQHNGIEAAVERSESQSSRKKACLDNFDLDSPVNLLSPDLENLKIGNYDENLENYEKSGDNYVKHVGKENKIGDVTAKENDLRAKEMVERNDDDDDTPTLHNPSITNHVVASTVKNESENRNSNNNKEDASMACLMEENESPLSNVIPTASSSQKIAVDAVKQEKKTSKSNLPSHLKYRVIAKGHRKLLPRKPTEPYVGIPAAQNTEVPAPNHSVRPLKEIIVSECPSECLQQYPEFVKLFKEEESKKLQNKVPSPQSNLLNKNMPSDKTTQHKQALLSQQQQQFLKSAMQQKQMDVDKISKIILAKRNQLYDLHKSDCGSCDSNFKKTAKLNNISKRNLRPLQQVNECTESNHDSSLSISCQKGHAKTVILLLERGADVDHVDKKGYTPLLHAAAGGHLKCVEFLLRYGADIEAHTEPSKDTSLSLVCSIGRKDVAELLLQHKANKEHRNSSDYTPLCLAANGGYVPVIKTLFKYDVEINSRTNSRLGISPLMLASMNGHTEAVKLLLSRGGDVNAQIETNRNTALTLACFQGRHEVVSLLLDHKAHIEHRAKKGYTPLMESAHGGYVDVARVLLNRGADLSAVHNNTTRDTALTIAAEKGHCKFVELLLLKGAQVDFRNKKGQTALWLACNGGHLEVVQLLLYSRADPNSKDAREISCLMAALKKGHVKIIKLLIRHVNQYPSDADCDKCLAQVVNNPELERRCRHCISVIDDAKVRQFQAADLNAKNLLLEEQAEKFVLENKRLAAQKKREKKKLKKKNNAKNVDSSVEASKSASNVGICDRITTAVEEDEEEEEEEEEEVAKKVNEQKKSSKNKKNKKNNNNTITSSDANNSNNNNNNSNNDMNNNKNEKDIKSLVENTPNTNNNNTEKSNKKEPCKKNENVSKSKSTSNVNSPKGKSQSRNISTSKETHNSCSVLDSFSPSSSDLQSSIYPPIILSNSSIGALDDFEKDFKPRVATKTSKSGFTYVDGKGSSKHNKGTKGGLKKVKEEGWQEVSRKCNKLVVPGKSVSRLIGRAGCNINAIREYTKATIDLNKMKNSNDNTALLKGSPESIQLAAKFIEVFIEDVDADIDKIISHHKASNPSFSQNNIQNIPPSKPPTNSSSVSSNSENILIGKTFYPTSNPWKQINTSVKNHTFSDINSSASFGNVSSSDSTTFVNGPTSQPLDTIDTNIAKNELLMNDIAFQYSSICKGIQDNDIENKPLNGEDINVSVSANAINLRNEDLTDFKDPFKSDISKPLPPIPSETPLNSECKFNDKTPVDSLNDLDTTAVYSPFHNHFSAFISARNKENKKNFASVAAASCVETSSFMAPSAHNFPPSSFLNEDTAQSIDSDLQAKAPGFRPAGFTAKPQSPLKKGDKLNSDQFASDDFFAYDPLHCKADEKRNSGIKPLKEFNLLENFSPPESILGYGAKSSILGKNFSNNHLEPKPHALLKPQSSGLNPEAPKFTSSFNTPLQPFSLYDHPSPSFNSFPYFNPQYQNNYNLPKVNLSNYNQNQLGLDRSTNDSNPYNNYLPSQEIFKRPMYQHFDNQNTQDYFSAYQKPFDSPKADKSLFHQNALRNQFSASNNQNRLPIWGQLPNSK